MCRYPAHSESRGARCTRLLLGSGETDWRQALKTALPEFMIPSSLTWLDHLPLTASGKTDRRALAALIDSSGEPDRPRVSEKSESAAAAPVQEKTVSTDLAVLWREVLKNAAMWMKTNRFSNRAARRWAP